MPVLNKDWQQEHLLLWQPSLGQTQASLNMAYFTSRNWKSRC